MKPYQWPIQIFVTLFVIALIIPFAAVTLFLDLIDKGPCGECGVRHGEQWK